MKDLNLFQRDAIVVFGPGNREREREWYTKMINSNLLYVFHRETVRVLSTRFIQLKTKSTLF